MKIGILGVGLIGGSFALACKKYIKNSYIIGWGRNKKRLKKAKLKKIIDDFTLNLKDLSDCDFIFVSLPVNLIVEKIMELKNFISEKTIVFDAGSTKKFIYEKLKKIKINFVPTHPLAGSEKTGFENASADLFVNKTTIITPYKKDKNLKKVVNLWRKIKSIPIVSTPEFHDRVIAVTSHLPHLISWCYVNTLKGLDRKKLFNFTAGSFRDLTRIARSSEILWKDIFLTNKKELLKVIKKYKKQLFLLEKYIKNNDEKKIANFIKRAKNWI